MYLGSCHESRRTADIFLDYDASDMILQSRGIQPSDILTQIANTFNFLCCATNLVSS